MLRIGRIGDMDQAYWKISQNECLVEFLFFSPALYISGYSIIRLPEDHLMNEHQMIKSSNNTVADPVAGYGGPRNMKSMRPPSVAIFFMIIFTGAGEPWPPCPTPRSATAILVCITAHASPYLLEFILFSISH